MKLFRFLLVGILFGIVMTKSEAISWFRIQEMFRFQSFHMYGIIGVAVVLGALMHFLIRRGHLKNILGDEIYIEPKPNTYKASILGGTIFRPRLGHDRCMPWPTIYIAWTWLLGNCGCHIKCISRYVSLWCIKK